jgi:hypothetical protein
VTQHVPVPRQRTYDSLTSRARSVSAVVSFPDPVPDPVTLVEVGRPGLPGCLTVTAIDLLDEEVPAADELVNQIMGTLVDHEGYLGSLFATTAGGRNFTVTAWSSVDDIKALRANAHGAAMRAFFNESLGSRVMTSVWVPLRLNEVWVRPDDGGAPQPVDAAQTAWL